MARTASPTPACTLKTTLWPLPSSCLQVAKGSSVCHDATTLLAVHFPFAAPRPDSCSAAFVVTPLTSLLVHGQAAGLAQSSVLTGLSLPSGFALLTTDSLKASVSPETRARSPCLGL